MENENISIPYYVIYASDYIVFRGKLKPDEIVEVFDAISDICLFGGNSFKTDNPIQKKFFERLLSILEKNSKKYYSSVENGKKGGRPKGSGKNKNPEKTDGFLLGYPNSKPKQNLDETNIIEENRIEENIKKDNKIEDKKRDILFDPLLDKCFSIYSEICIDLPKLRFERRNKEIRELLSNFLFETENNLEYFKDVCTKANKLKILCDNKLDFKSVIKNHIAIANGKFQKEDNSQVMSKLKFSWGKY